MNRLRVRVELNRRRAGVPMHEMVSIVEETHRFFQLLATDVEIDSERGEWYASNFDPESLNFTAEFDGFVSPEQVSAFGSSFSGATSLRRETIGQFTRIADFIGEDELVGFGLYQSDEENEPSDWRCLSRQDAMRFADEISLLARASGEPEQEAPLPAVMNGSVGGRRLFKDRREREKLAADPARYIREIESSLTRRIAQLEGEIESQARKLQIFEASPEAEERFFKMLSAMESHWNHAALPQAPQPLMLSAPEPVALGGPMFVQPVHIRSSRLGLVIGLAAASACALIVAAMSVTTFGLNRNAKPAVITLSTAIPRAPGLTATPAIQPARPPLEPAATAVRRDTAPEMERQFALEIPQELKPMIDSAAAVSVNVAIDSDGNVTTADVASVKGESAGLLVPEALKAARWFHFRPARQGKKTIASETMLTFTFSPEAVASFPEIKRPAGN